MSEETTRSDTLFAYCERCRTLWLEVRGGWFEHECRGIDARSAPERAEVPTHWAVRTVKFLSLNRKI